jgi:hypothetical protein
MDSQMFGLLRATVHPLLDLQKLVAKRIQDTKGIVGKLRGFWDSKEYLFASKLAQQRVQVWLTCFARLETCVGYGAQHAEMKLRVTRHVQAAIEDLMNRVHVQTRIDVQKVRDQCELLPLMNQKLDAIIGLQREQSGKLDRIEQFQAQQSRRHSAAMKKESRCGARQTSASKETCVTPKRDLLTRADLSSLSDHCIPQTQIKMDQEPFAAGASSKVYKVIH